MRSTNFDQEKISESRRANNMNNIQKTPSIVELTEKAWSGHFLDQDASGTEGKSENMITVKGVSKNDVKAKIEKIAKDNCILKKNDEINSDDKSFEDEDQPLSRNSKIHFSCKKCDKTYSNRFSLHRHKISHTERNHSCTFCLKKFFLKHHLKQHEKTHMIDRGEHFYQNVKVLLHIDFLQMLCSFIHNTF